MPVRDFPFVGAPARLQEVLDWDAAGRPPGREPRRASTVLLLREGSAGPEVVLLQRAATMAFAAAFHAFPGGGVEAADAEAPLPDDLVRRTASVMGVPDGLARAHLAAAVREVDEECGAVLDPADLVVRARWVTPVFEGRRFDAWILAARAPAGFEPRQGSTESVTMAWSDPRRVLTDFAEGTVMLLPPTLVALEQLVEAGSVEAYLALPTEPEVVLPVAVHTDAEGWVMRTGRED